VATPKLSGAQPGNNNAGKTLPVRAALEHALKTYKTSKVKQATALREIQNKAIEMALDGNTEMIKYIADRNEGKPIQTIAGDVTAPVTVIVKRMIDE